MKSKFLQTFYVILVSALSLSACASSGLTPSPAPTAATTKQSSITVPPSPVVSETGTQPQVTALSSVTATTPQETPVLGDAAGFPDPSQFEWQIVVDGFTRPVDLADTADGKRRILVVEQRGVIRMVENGTLLEEAFLDLTDRVGSSANEQGLLGIALDPDYLENGTFYLHFTDLNGDTVIARYQSSADGLHGDAASERVIIRADQPYANHNGGDLEFGPDGYLYVGLGDGGSQGDPQGNGQNPDVVLGKLLRLDVRGQDTYVIPVENPFGAGGGLGEVWAMGLRNPWRFTFDRATGDLYIADVGQNLFEEVNYLPAGASGGANFGWDYREGAHEYSGNPPGNLDLIDPIFEYTHNDGCSVTGGYVYRGQALPEFYGIYLVGDYCTGVIWGVMRDGSGQWQSEQLFDVSGNISSFGQDESGEIYLLDHTGGIYRLSRR